jgi:Domain of unknown function (DUF4406)
MKKVYIASPYTTGDKEENVRISLEVANELINMGFCPFAPLLSHYQNQLHPQPEEKWLEMDFEWVKVCDYLLRLPGKSKGADMEVKVAEENGIKVVFSIDELVNYFPITNENIDKIKNTFYVCFEEGKIITLDYFYSITKDNEIETYFLNMNGKYHHVDFPLDDLMEFEFAELSLISKNYSGYPKIKELYDKMIDKYPKIKLECRKKKLKKL